MQQSIIHVYHDDLLLDEDEENDHDDNVRPENDDTMEVDSDGDGDSNLNQATSRHPRRAENTIAYEDFTKIRDKIISKLKVKGRKLIIFYHFNLLFKFLKYFLNFI